MAKPPSSVDELVENFSSKPRLKALNDGSIILSEKSKPISIIRDYIKMILETRPDILMQGSWKRTQDVLSSSLLQDLRKRANEILDNHCEHKEEIQAHSDSANNSALDILLKKAEKELFDVDKDSEQWALAILAKLREDELYRRYESPLQCFLLWACRDGSFNAQKKFQYTLDLNKDSIRSGYFRKLLDVVLDVDSDPFASGLAQRNIRAGFYFLVAPLADYPLVALRGFNAEWPDASVEKYAAIMFREKIRDIVIPPILNFTGWALLRRWARSSQPKMLRKAGYSGKPLQELDLAWFCFREVYGTPKIRESSKEPSATQWQAMVALYNRKCNEFQLPNVGNVDSYKQMLETCISICRRREETPIVSIPTMTSEDSDEEEIDVAAPWDPDAFLYLSQGEELQQNLVLSLKALGSEESALLLLQYGLALEQTAMANYFGVSQPTISRKIKKLENQILKQIVESTLSDSQKPASLNDYEAIYSNAREPFREIALAYFHRPGLLWQRYQKQVDALTEEQRHQHLSSCSPIPPSPLREELIKIQRQIVDGLFTWLIGELHRYGVQTTEHLDSLSKKLAEVVTDWSVPFENVQNLPPGK